jgi:hypothetical protein
MNEGSSRLLYSKVPRAPELNEQHPLLLLASRLE